MIYALTIAVILHLLIWLNFTLKPKPPENTPPTLIEVSFITQFTPIKAKQNDQIVAENKSPVTPELPKPEPIKPVVKPIEKKPVVKPVEQKKEPSKPKIVAVQKSETVVKKEEKTLKTEPPKKVEIETLKEKPRLSLESLQQQISQVGSEVQQQVSERDKYISAFSSKVKRIGQAMYDSGTLPAGMLETKIEIHADGSLNNFKITRSSGNKKLDDAVENMIRSSAPYDELPFQLQNEARSLTFTRVWEFYGD